MKGASNEKVRPYSVENFWSNTEQLDEDKIGNMVCIDRQLTAKRKGQRRTHGENKSNTTNTNDDDMTALDHTLNLKQVPQVQLNKTQTNCYVGSNQSSQIKAFEYAAEKISGHDVVHGETPYCVFWYG